MSVRAVVLSGGGARGGYHIGAWQALRELGIDYQMITGTSVGALNGAIMAQGDFETARDMWENLTTADVVNTDVRITAGDKNEQRDEFAQFMLESLRKGGADSTPLLRTIAAVVDEQKCRESPIDFGLVTVKYPSMKPVMLWKNEIPEGKLYDYMLASASIFPAFKMHEIDGEQFIDGGYYDGMPINMALEHGADEVIVVVLDGIGINRRPRLSGQKITYIESHWDLGNTLIFDGELARRIMRLGYLDTMRVYGKYEGAAYTFEIGELAKNSIVLSGAACDCADLLLPDGLKSSPSLLAAGRRLAELLREYGCIPNGALRLKSLVSDHSRLANVALPMMTEVCAEALGVDYLNVYGFREIDRAIWNIYSAERKEFDRTNESGGEADGVSDKSGFTELISRLRTLGGHAVTHYIKRLIDQALAGKSRPEMWLAASLLPREFWAAAYLCVLERAEEFLGD